MKEKLCYVAKNYEIALKEASESSEAETPYELPDGNAVIVGSPRFMAPEVLFHPSLYGIESSGVHEHSFDSIVKCDADIRKQLWGNLALAGGNTCFEGM